MAKIISPQQMTGSLGEKLVDARATEIGFLYHPTGRTEAGIDGYLEIRDPETSEALGKILGVQVKTTRDGNYSNETEAGFEYLLDETDLEYWRGANIPVIIVLVHLGREELFWKRVDLGTGDKGRRLTVDRASDAFDRSAADALAVASVKKATFGVYFPPMRAAESAHMNMVPINLPEKMYVAASPHKSGWKGLEALLVEDERPRDDWIIRGGVFWSFCDPRESSVKTIIDVGSVEIIETETIALSDDQDEEHAFIDLLRRTMIQQFDGILNYSRRRGALYFQPTPETIARRYHYRSLKQKTHAEVVSVYKKKDTDRTLYVRHHAFGPRFWRLGDEWYVSVTPTFVFTWDGYKRDKFEAGRLAGKKKLENNAALLGQFIMWRNFLVNESAPKTGANLFAEDLPSEAPILQFGSLDALEMPRGVPEDQWAKDEPPLVRDPRQELLV